MHPGAVNENVEVTAAAALLESSDAQIGQVIETKAVSDLPLNGRNFAQLAILGTGVVGVGFGPSGTIGSGTRPDDPRPGAELMSNGNREMSNDYLMDGGGGSSRVDRCPDRTSNRNQSGKRSASERRGRQFPQECVDHLGVSA
jgi:hypothetical protein